MDGLKEERRSSRVGLAALDEGIRISKFFSSAGGVDNLGQGEGGSQILSAS